jgi:hypothetical protein
MVSASGHPPDRCLFSLRKWLMLVPERKPTASTCPMGAWMKAILYGRTAMLPMHQNASLADNAPMTLSVGQQLRRQVRQPGSRRSN